MYNDIYPMKHVQKTTDTFRRSKFQLPQNHSLKAESYTASRVTITELLMLVSNFMVNVRLKER